jgi:ATP-dependent Zn protease
MMGAERKSIVIPEHERRNTAYHESGHTRGAAATGLIQSTRSRSFRAAGPWA